MDKLKMHSKDKTQENFEILQRLFPNAVTETITGYDEDGKAIVERAIDKDVLQQEINAAVVEGKDERYQFTWPDKKRAIVSANAPINKTLRPCREESVNFDTTENLYIEGDNLEVLKLLQETYLGKIKMIYIDPPYNTGHDFVYNDKFSVSPDEWDEMSGELDEYGNRLAQNTESNGRFHTDWLNMIYPRLKIARDLLTDDGMIFISIDDHEVDSLKSICKEIFGVTNIIATFIWQKRTSPDARKKVSTAHEYVLLVAKNSICAEHSIHTLPLDNEDATKYSNPDNDPKGPWVSTDFGAQGYRPNQMYKITTPGGAEYYPSEGRCWKNTEDGFIKLLQEGRMWFGADGKGVPRKKLYLNEREGKNIWTWWDNKSVGHTQEATQQFANLMDSKTIFDYSKPVRLIKQMLLIASNNDSLILDFFSGSATSAHAVMRQNFQDVFDDKKGKRKFIMVQLPEKTDEKSEAYKAGYKNICEIGKDRIRRAGEMEKKNVYATAGSSLKWNDERKAELGDDYVCPEDVDIGFRVLKLDSSNMKDVYYNPADFSKNLLDTTIDNIKEDRTAEDLLFQVMLDLGVLLSSKIVETEVAGKKIFNVSDGYLMACFDEDVNEEVITAVAKQHPIYFVMRDSSLSTDTTATNFDQIFETYSPDTVRKVI